MFAFDECKCAVKFSRSSALDTIAFLNEARGSSQILADDGDPPKITVERKTRQGSAFIGYH